MAGPVCTTACDGPVLWLRRDVGLGLPKVEDTWLAVRALVVQPLPEMDRLVADYLGDRDDLASIERDELLDGLVEDRFLVIDVRPTAEHRAGHLLGAISVPPDQLPGLPDDREIVTYCRGPYRAYADTTVRWLTANGPACPPLHRRDPRVATGG